MDRQNRSRRRSSENPEDVNVTATVGFTFFTIDPSDDVDQKADDYDESLLREKFSSVQDNAPWYESYLGKTIDLPTGTTIELTEEACMRAAVKYGAAIRKALGLGDHIRTVNEAANQDYEIELSVDETDQPTTLAEHYIIADQCLKGGMKLVSLAPRFIGELEKGVDYKGNVIGLEASLNDHAAIAELLGPYKLSLHSGSDKLSMYPALARATKGKFHVKTAGPVISKRFASSPDTTKPCIAGSSSSHAIATTQTKRPTTSQPPSRTSLRLIKSPMLPNWSECISNVGRTSHRDSVSPSPVAKSSTARSVRF